MIEGSGAGSVHRINGSGSGRPKNIGKDPGSVTWEYILQPDRTAGEARPGGAAVAATQRVGQHEP
jgi:hypothetical protein